MGFSFQEPLTSAFGNSALKPNCAEKAGPTRLFKKQIFFFLVFLSEADSTLPRVSSAVNGLVAPSASPDGGAGPGHHVLELLWSWVLILEES